jgi:hypothetical protein
LRDFPAEVARLAQSPSCNVTFSIAARKKPCRISYRWMGRTGSPAATPFGSTGLASARDRDRRQAAGRGPCSPATQSFAPSVRFKASAKPVGFRLNHQSAEALHAGCPRSAISRSPLARRFCMAGATLVLSASETAAPG